MIFILYIWILCAKSYSCVEYIDTNDMIWYHCINIWYALIYKKHISPITGPNHIYQLDHLRSGQCSIGKMPKWQCGKRRICLWQNRPEETWWLWSVCPTWFWKRNGNLWNKKRNLWYGCFLKWWYPQNTSEWSFLVGKPMVVGYHHFRKPP